MWRQRSSQENSGALRNVRQSLVGAAPRLYACRTEHRVVCTCPFTALLVLSCLQTCERRLGRRQARRLSYPRWPSVCAVSDAATCCMLCSVLAHLPRSCDDAVTPTEQWHQRVSTRTPDDRASAHPADRKAPDGAHAASCQQSALRMTLAALEAHPDGYLLQALTEWAATLSKGQPRTRARVAHECEHLQAQGSPPLYELSVEGPPGFGPPGLPSRRSHLQHAPPAQCTGELPAKMQCARLPPHGCAPHGHAIGNLRTCALPSCLC